MNQRMLKGYLFTIASAVIYGCMPLMAKYIYADGVNPLTLVFLRNLLALPSLALLVFLQKKDLRIPRKSLPYIGLISALGCCITPVLLFSSYRYIASGTATVFHYIYPAIVVIGGILFFGKKIKASNLLCVALCLLGIALFYTPGETLNLTGCLLSLGSGITFAAYVLLLSVFPYKDISGFRFSFYVAGFGSIFTLLICLSSSQLVLPRSVTGWLLCLLFALAVTTGAVVLFQQGTFLIGGEKTSVLCTLEPITSILIGALVFQETVGLRTLFGSSCVILASILIAVFDLRNKEV